MDTYVAYVSLSIGLLILFGGIFAPMAELRLGLGGASYADFIDSVHLPKQLAQVDPIVASFTGGAVGVIAALFAVEYHNVKEQERQACVYCSGSGYLTCAACSGKRIIDPASSQPCSTCSATGKVMCTSCLCTGRLLVTEHDPRLDPLD